MLQQNRDAYMRKIKELDYRISYLNQRIEQHQQQQLTRYKTEPPLFCGNNESKPFGLGFKSKPVITKYTATKEIDAIEVLDHVKMIRCGSSITYLLTENNELYACGTLRCSISNHT
jgi:alpha-tubulin suppressor-like RCC1 family protein